MIIDDALLSTTERLDFSLRELYSTYGFSPYRMGKFEEYDLYSKNKSFLVSDSVITFTDVNGKLMALKPDITLSIIKNYNDGEQKKLYYSENVYRISSNGDAFKEIMQSGLECIGELDNVKIAECLFLAAESLSLINTSFKIDVSSLDILNAALDYLTESSAVQNEILTCAAEKNTHGIDAICKSANIEKEKADVLRDLLSLSGNWESEKHKLEAVCIKLKCEDAYIRLRDILEEEVLHQHRDNIVIDFSVISDRNYYNGLVFRGFIKGIPKRILSGGCYDKLMARMGKESKAVGFAIYPDAIERIDDLELAHIPHDEMLNIALPKGRLGEKVYDLLEKAGYGCPTIKEDSRKLVFENPEVGVRYFWVKPFDVSTYVERGVADVGIAGKDILLEHRSNTYELLDLGIGKCNMVVAAPKDYVEDTTRTLRVATKFTHIAAQYFLSKDRDIDIVPLNGSIEIAPILGLTDVIVDIVETGTTLRENNLEVRETILPISARLIANKSSYSFKHELIDALIKGMKHD